MSAGRDSLIARDARLLGHCREGFALARRDEAYRANVLERLRDELQVPPSDLWAAIAWVWAVALGESSPASGELCAAVPLAAELLARGLAGDEPTSSLLARWHAAPGIERLALGSILRSHPFADLRAWSARPTSAA